MGAVGTVLAAVITGFFSYKAGTRSTSGETASGPPSVSVRAADWINDIQQPGRYKVSGEAKNLAKGQLIWTYNEPLGPHGEDGPLYPDPGPCPVEPDNTWSCDGGFAGEASSRGQRFKLWAMVVDEPQAYTAIKTKVGLGAPGNSYPSLVEVPHVAGDHTADSITVTRPS